MKEASGELNMTVVTIVAVAAVGALFYLFVWPMIQASIVSQTCKTYGSDWKAIKTDEVVGGTGNATVKKWKCCPDGNAASTACVDADTGKE
jgi:hypothetical protein